MVPAMPRRDDMGRTPRQSAEAGGADEHGGHELGRGTLGGGEMGADRGNDANCWFAQMGPERAESRRAAVPEGKTLPGDCTSPAPRAATPSTCISSRATASLCCAVSKGVQNGIVKFGSDLHENLVAAEADFVTPVDTFITATAISTPSGSARRIQPGELNLNAAQLRFLDCSPSSHRC